MSREDKQDWAEAYDKEYCRFMERKAFKVVRPEKGIKIHDTLTRHETFSKQVFIIPLPWIKMEIFELRTPTVTQRRSARPDGSTCFILLHHVLALIFAFEQIVLDIIDVV